MDFILIVPMEAWIDIVLTEISQEVSHSSYWDNVFTCLFCTADTRSHPTECQHCISPFKQDNIARPPLGKFLACVDVQGDIVVCGGGPRLSMWSGRTLTPLSVMDTGNNTQHTALFNDDLVWFLPCYCFVLRLMWRCN